jgi:uncharacterized membrane protein
VTAAATIATRPLAKAAESTAVAARMGSVDLVRGLAMIVMVLDHTRDFVHEAAFRFDPVDVTQTDPATFFTRWITHFVAPAFVLLAGVSASLMRQRGIRRGELARFLLLRGLLLIALELSVVRVGIWFSVDPSFAGMLQVIWVLGVSMIVLAGLIFLPTVAIAALSIAVIVAHGAWHLVPPLNDRGWLTTILHEPGAIRVFGSPEPNLIVLYPLVPWFAVMALGYVLGGIYRWDAPVRRQVLLRAGAALVVAWLVLRFVNVYGDPSPWETYADPSRSVVSFLNAEKYPPSLVFLLMTGGPILMALGLFDGKSIAGSLAAPRRWVAAIGRAPLFFYVVQWYVVHSLAIVLGLVAGQAVTWQWLAPPDKYAAIPPGVGFPLVVVYLAWLASVAVLVPLTDRYARIRGRRGGILRYF